MPGTEMRVLNSIDFISRCFGIYKLNPVTFIETRTARNLLILCLITLKFNYPICARFSKQNTKLTFTAFAFNFNEHTSEEYNYIRLNLNYY